ncbi:hypothetical protein [Desulfospira joergensenii]|uniref:hypothetical protein n=1 Tax=Desulfospira joergensenii TaxID=53329 RepID=UPI0003B314A0|nr:hypothetical protein [Desulfospira joergensenii]
MIEFKKAEIEAEFSDPSGKPVQRIIEVRTDPVTLKKSRITPHRSLEKERGTDRLYSPPESDLIEEKCPFCPGNRDSMVPRLKPEISRSGHLVYNRSVLFPNLFPYTEWSAVSLFDDTHHVEVGTAEPDSYGDCFINCSRYLERVIHTDPRAHYMSITQNHLPGAGGSLVHPHLQVHATRECSNLHGLIRNRAREYEAEYGNSIFSDLISAEKAAGERYIGATGSWEWIAAFAPSGFYEIWGISPDNGSLLIPQEKKVWQDLARGVIKVQQFYKSLNRNSYNLALISVEDATSFPSLRVSLTARSSYAPWVRSDFTGFEISSGEMATFTRPESVAEMARKFWQTT